MAHFSCQTRFRRERPRRERPAANVHGHRELLGADKDLKVTMHTPNPDLELLAFYEIARRANLTDNPELMQSPAFQRAKQLYDARAGYFQEALGKKEAIDYFVDLPSRRRTSKSGQALGGRLGAVRPGVSEAVSAPSGKPVTNDLSSAASNVISTISGFVPTRSGGPQVPTPQLVKTRSRPKRWRPWT